MQVERNRIAIFYSQVDSTHCHNVFSELKTQLLGAQRQNPGELNYTLDEFDTSTLSANQHRVRESLSHTRVVVVLEGGSLMASSFVQAEEPITKLLSEIRRHGGVSVLRIAIRPVQERLIPAELSVLQTCGEYATPLSTIDNDGHRELAVVAIVDEVAGEYQNWVPSNSRDEFGDDPPVIVDRSNLVNPISIFPKSIVSWVKSSEGLATLNGIPGGGFADEILGWLGNQDSLIPPWLLPLHPFSNAASTPVLSEACARLEQQAARLYPRHRDAYHCLHASLNDLTLSELSMTLARTRADDFDRLNRLSSQIQNSRERSLHFQQIVVSLLRKHAGWWAAVESVESELNVQNAINEHVASYLLAWRCLPACQLAILQRHQRCSSVGSVNASLSQCLILLDRMSHWLKASNSILNSVDGVPGTPNIEEVALWTT